MEQVPHRGGSLPQPHQEDPSSSPHPRVPQLEEAYAGAPPTRSATTTAAPTTAPAFEVMSHEIPCRRTGSEGDRAVTSVGGDRPALQTTSPFGSDIAGSHPPPPLLLAVEECASSSVLTAATTVLSTPQPSSSCTHINTKTTVTTRAQQQRAGTSQVLGSHPTLPVRMPVGSNSSLPRAAQARDQAPLSDPKNVATGAKMCVSSSSGGTAATNGSRRPPLQRKKRDASSLRHLRVCIGNALAEVENIESLLASTHRCHRSRSGGRDAQPASAGVAAVATWLDNESLMPGGSYAATPLSRGVSSGRPSTARTIPSRLSERVLPLPRVPVLAPVSSCCMHLHHPCQQAVPQPGPTVTPTDIASSGFFFTRPASAPRHSFHSPTHDGSASSSPLGVQVLPINGALPMAGPTSTTSSSSRLLSSTVPSSGSPFLELHNPSLISGSYTSHSQSHFSSTVVTTVNTANNNVMTTSLLSTSNGTGTATRGSGGDHSSGNSSATPGLQVPVRGRVGNGYPRDQPSSASPPDAAAPNHPRHVRRIGSTAAPASPLCVAEGHPDGNHHDLRQLFTTHYCSVQRQRCGHSASERLQVLLSIAETLSMYCGVNWNSPFLVPTEPLTPLGLMSSSRFSYPQCPVAGVATPTASVGSTAAAPEGAARENRTPPLSSPAGGAAPHAVRRTPPPPPQPNRQFCLPHGDGPPEVSSVSLLDPSADGAYLKEFGGLGSSAPSSVLPQTGSCCASPMTKQSKCRNSSNIRHSQESDGLRSQPPPRPTGSTGVGRFSATPSSISIPHFTSDATSTLRSQLSSHNNRSTSHDPEVVGEPPHGGGSPHGDHSGESPLPQQGAHHPVTGKSNNGEPAPKASLLRCFADYTLPSSLQRAGDNTGKPTNTGSGTTNHRVPLNTVGVPRTDTPLSGTGRDSQSSMQPPGPRPLASFTSDEASNRLQPSHASRFDESSRKDASGERAEATTSNANSKMEGELPTLTAAHACLVTSLPDKLSAVDSPRPHPQAGEHLWSSAATSPRATDDAHASGQDSTTELLPGTDPWRQGHGSGATVTTYDHEGHAAPPPAECEEEEGVPPLQTPVCQSCGVYPPPEPKTSTLPNHTRDDHDEHEEVGESAASDVLIASEGRVFTLDATCQACPTIFVEGACFTPLPAAMLPSDQAEPGRLGCCPPTRSCLPNPQLAVPEGYGAERLTLLPEHGGGSGRGESGVGLSVRSRATEVGDDSFPVALSSFPSRSNGWLVEVDPAALTAAATLLGNAVACAAAEAIDNTDDVRALSLTGRVAKGGGMAVSLSSPLVECRPIAHSDPPPESARAAHPQPDDGACVSVVRGNGSVITQEVAGTAISPTADRHPPLGQGRDSVSAGMEAGAAPLSGKATTGGCTSSVCGGDANDDLRNATGTLVIPLSLDLPTAVTDAVCDSLRTPADRTSAGSTSVHHLRLHRELHDGDPRTPLRESDSDLSRPGFPPRSGLLGVRQAAGEDARRASADAGPATGGADSLKVITSHGEDERHQHHHHPTQHSLSEAMTALDKGHNFSLPSASGSFVSRFGSANHRISTESSQSRLSMATCGEASTSLSLCGYVQSHINDFFRLEEHRSVGVHPRYETTCSLGTVPEPSSAQGMNLNRTVTNQMQLGVPRQDTGGSTPKGSMLTVGAARPATQRDEVSVSFAAHALSHSDLTVVRRSHSFPGEGGGRPVPRQEVSPADEVTDFRAQVGQPSHETPQPSEVIILPCRAPVALPPTPSSPRATERTNIEPFGPPDAQSVGDASPPTIRRSGGCRRSDASSTATSSPLLAPRAVVSAYFASPSLPSWTATPTHHRCDVTASDHFLGESEVGWQPSSVWPPVLQPARRRTDFYYSRGAVEVMRHSRASSVAKGCLGFAYPSVRELQGVHFSEHVKLSTTRRDKAHFTFRRSSHVPDSNHQHINQERHARRGELARRGAPMLSPTEALTGYVYLGCQLRVLAWDRSDVEVDAFAENARAKVERLCTARTARPPPDVAR